MNDELDTRIRAMLSAAVQDAPPAPALPRSPAARPQRVHGPRRSLLWVGAALAAAAAAITAVVELVFPLVLWAYTYWALAWDVFVRERRRENAPGSFAQATRAGHGGAGDDRFGNARQVHAEQDGRVAEDHYLHRSVLADHFHDDVDAAHRPNAIRPLTERSARNGRAVDPLDGGRDSYARRDVNDSPASLERPDRREASAPDDSPARRDRRGRSAKRMPHRLNGKGSHPGHDDDRSGLRGGGGGHSSKPSSTRRP